MITSYLSYQGATNYVQHVSCKNGVKDALAVPCSKDNITMLLLLQYLLAYKLVSST